MSKLPLDRQRRDLKTIRSVIDGSAPTPKRGERDILLDGIAAIEETLAWCEENRETVIAWQREKRGAN